MTESRRPGRGLWGVVATPFVRGGTEVDHPSLERLVRYYREVGAIGLTVLGVFGEASSLTADERRRVLETVAGAVDLDLIVGVTSLATNPAIAEIESARTAIGDRMIAAMVQINSPRAPEVVSHLTAIHRATGAGIVLQNYPAASGVSVTVVAQQEALGQLPMVVALKEEAAPTAVRIAQLAGTTSIPVFGGLGGIGLVDELESGAAGAMTGFSFPEGLLAAIEAHRAGGFIAARAALSPYLPLINFEQQPGIGLAIRKECLRVRGLIDAADVRLPAGSIDDRLRGWVRAHVEACAVATGAGLS